jgi:hypothetical protein
MKYIFHKYNNTYELDKLDVYLQNIVTNETKIIMS